jgi:hypothetical protein
MSAEMPQPENIKLTQYTYMAKTSKKMKILKSAKPLAKANGSNNENIGEEAAA